MKDFESLMQLEEMSFEAEDFPTYTQQEMGKVSENVFQPYQTTLV